jgi:NCS1 family nucleobase:cation symporter-1
VKHIKMADAVRNRFAKIKGGAKAKTKAAGWILPQEKTSFADEGTW